MLLRRKPVIILALILIPPTAALGLAMTLGWVLFEWSLGGVVFLLGAYAGWIAVLAGLAEIVNLFRGKEEPGPRPGTLYQAPRPPNQATAKDARKPTVFISYCHADSHFVDRLADDLKASGVDVWIDKWKIKVGDSITQKIDEGIGASDRLIVVLSRASVSSKWVREELNAATIKNVEREKHAYILPVLIEDCELPTLLQHRKYANFKDEPEQAIQELLEVIRPEVIPNLAPIEPEVVSTALPIKQEVVSAPVPIEPEMILIPAGEFLIGSDPRNDEDASSDEQPQHTLYMPEYYIARTPVTNAHYLPFVQATGHRKPDHWAGGKPLGGKDDHPVVNVTWHDAVAYCQWLAEITGKAYRLPSEAEWEKAARGSDGRIYPWGDDPPDERRCNFGENLNDTTPVGQYSPQGDSPYSCADVAGNVCEWCNSLYKSYRYDPTDGREDATAEGSRVARGSSFLDYGKLARCSSRLGFLPIFRDEILGFRVAVSTPT
jgi:formylglycine-generating enzyme required for sulfatase activity